MSGKLQQEPATGPISHLESCRFVEEDRAWGALYLAVHRPSTAEEVVKHLDADPQTKRSHLALYILARSTLRERKACQARTRRIAAIVRAFPAVLVYGPLRLLVSEYALIRDALLAALPAVQWQPTATCPRRLKADPELALSTDLFGSTGTQTLRGWSGASRKAA
jgi:hypothetical protein